MREDPQFWFATPDIETGEYTDVSKNRGKNPKMDGENNGKPYFLMDDLGVKPTIFGNINTTSRSHGFVTWNSIGTGLKWMDLDGDFFQPFFSMVKSLNPPII